MTAEPNTPVQISGLPPGILTEAEEPVFQAPWQAHAFALVNQLTAAKQCSWAEWTDYLANEISATEQVSPGSKSYYEQWVGACEKLLVAKGLLDPTAIDQKMTDLLAEREGEHQH
ncbi:nitrile hydratase accessory protein [Romeria aff. gracilis LEGE 07310]|uniref:Nitrile hydratase accessory protein n=1 Tax=Vasconcelosia minhoensis LEGE 07310 TaxID=915328 RepID=A0A8J7A823_9CYAN|nr:nitrile hydratase accessory protein [Romeria gracilis]MBE9077770.1 nitrile hydratase accessory protein [Romeria aff. gracilis LEGE 07310]